MYRTKIITIMCTPDRMSLGHMQGTQDRTSLSHRAIQATPQNGTDCHRAIQAKPQNATDCHWAIQATPQHATDCHWAIQATPQNATDCHRAIQGTPRNATDCHRAIHTVSDTYVSMLCTRITLCFTVFLVCRPHSSINWSVFQLWSILS